MAGIKRDEQATAEPREEQSWEGHQRNDMNVIFWKRKERKKEKVRKRASAPASIGLVSFHWLPCEQEQILRVFQEKISRREYYFSSCVWKRRESFDERVSAVGQSSAGCKSGCVMMCCQKFNRGYQKKPFHSKWQNPRVAEVPALAERGEKGKYFLLVFPSGNVSSHFS